MSKSLQTIVVFNRALEGGLMGLSNTLSWDNDPIRKTWSAELLKSVEAAKPLLDQANAEAFIKGYGELEPPFQLKFWAELMVAISWHESKWKPDEIYHEPPPLNVDSVGLLQLSCEDEKPYGLEPLSRTAKSLQDPLVNIRRGVTIIAKLVSHDKVVESSSRKKFGGASRYWSVIRQGRHLEDIGSAVREAMSMKQ
jgi:hypothetical protein